MIRSALMEKAQSMIKLSLERLVSPSEQNNVGSEATKVPQDSEKCNATKRVKCESKNTNDKVMEEEPEVMVMIVPYADLYNNEKDLIEASFGETRYGLLMMTTECLDGMH